MYLAENLKYLREKNGETRNDISRLLSTTGYGFSEMTVRRYENGESEPELGKVIMLAEHYNVTVDDLLMARMQDDMPVYLKNIQYLRQKYNMKLQDTAYLLRVSKADASKYQNGAADMALEQIIKLADYFGVSLDQLVKHDLSKKVGTYDKENAD